MVSPKDEIATEPRQTAVGIRPAVAVGTVLIDSMLFGGEALSGGATLPVSASVAALWSAIVFVLQKRSGRDSTLSALGKALTMGVLVAIPTPIPTWIAAGLVGGRKLLRRS